MSKAKKAFTLIELMITLIILSVIAGFAIPNYTRRMERAKERDAAYNLEIIREGVRLFIAHNRADPANLPGIANINTTLNLNIIEQQDNTYSCGDTAATTNTYQCDANNASSGWTVSFQLENNDGDVYCSGGDCPTL